MSVYSHFLMPGILKTEFAVGFLSVLNGIKNSTDNYIEIFSDYLAEFDNMQPICCLLALHIPAKRISIHV